MTSLLLVLYALLMNAQNAPVSQQQGAAAQAQAAEQLASISGTARDASTGEPVADVLVNVRLGAKYETAKTGLKGEYSFRGLQPGRYALEARWRDAGGVVVTRMVTLRAGQQLNGADVRLARLGVIAGIITDENKSPLAGVAVTARWHCYFQGVLQPFGGAAATTDDRGEYRLQGLKPDRAYVLTAGLPEPVQVAAGNRPTPARKSGWERLYYPNSPVPEGAIAVSLVPGEVREGVDFRMRRSAAFCVSGAVTGSSAEGARIYISTADRAPGWSVPLGGGTTDASGRFSACGLPPGEYEAAARPLLGSSERGVAGFRISDRNVRNVVVDLRPPMEVRGEARWAEVPPANPPSGPIRIVLMPVGRSPSGAESLRTDFTVPGEFAFRVFADQYTLRLYDLPPGVYAKDIRYGGVSVLRAALTIGAAPPGDPVRVTLAHEGGALRVLAADRDQKPVQDAGICLFPPDVAAVADLAHYYVPYGTDQDGYRTIPNLAPGRYYVLATTLPFDSTPEMLTKLMQARSRAKEIEVMPGQTRDVTLEPLELK